MLSDFFYLVLDNLKIIMHHGEDPNNMTNYKSRLTPDEMYLYAKKMNVDFYILGRTHTPLIESKEKLIHINPGSPVATVHNNSCPSIGILDTNKHLVQILSCNEKNQVLISYNY